MVMIIWTFIALRMECDELQVVFKELTRDGDKSMVVKTNLIGRKR